MENERLDTEAIASGRGMETPRALITQHTAPDDNDAQLLSSNDGQIVQSKKSDQFSESPGNTNRGDKKIDQEDDQQDQLVEDLRQHNKRIAFVKNKSVELMSK